MWREAKSGDERKKKTEVHTEHSPRLALCYFLRSCVLVARLAITLCTACFSFSLHLFLSPRRCHLKPFFLYAAVYIFVNLGAQIVFFLRFLCFSADAAAAAAVSVCELKLYTVFTVSASSQSYATGHLFYSISYECVNTKSWSISLSFRSHNWPCVRARLCTFFPLIHLACFVVGAGQSQKIPYRSWEMVQFSI